MLVPVGLVLVDVEEGLSRVAARQVGRLWGQADILPELEPPAYSAL